MKVVGVSICREMQTTQGLSHRIPLWISALSITAWDWMNNYLCEHNFETRKWVSEDFLLVLLIDFFRTSDETRHMNVWSMKSSKIELVLFSATYIQTAGAYTAIGPWTFPMPSSGRMPLPRAPETSPWNEWLKGVQWFAWPGCMQDCIWKVWKSNQIFWLSEDWAAPNAITEYLWAVYGPVVRWCQPESGAGGGGHVGQRSNQ